MDVQKLSADRSSKFKPWSFEYTAMAPNLLLMCKLLVLLLLAHHFYYYLNDPFLPFIPALDYFNTIPGVFETTLRIIFIIACVSLFLNLYVRNSCIVLGLIIILQQLASKPAFANHTFVCGCVLLLAGLSARDKPPLLLIWQLSLIYIGASINKLLDPDWLNGTFMDNWLLNARQNPIYIYMAELLPEKWFALFLSWSAMLIELGIGILLLFKRYRYYMLWVILIFHTALFTLTSFRYGHFYENLLIILLVFLIWTKGSLVMKFQEGRTTLLRRLHGLLNWDKKIVWKSAMLPKGTWLHLKASTGQSYTNFNAIRKALAHTPGFFILLFCFDAFIRVVFYNERTAMFIINLITVWGLILFFLPVLKQKLFKSKVD